MRLVPEDPEVLAALAEAEEGLGERTAAEGHARAALERDPKHPVALLVVALLRMKEERYAEARQSLEAALTAAPDSAKLHYQLSLACARLGDRECAARHVELYKKARRDTDEGVDDLRSQSLEGGGSSR
jgi:predicted Zn-dependent protease